MQQSSSLDFKLVQRVCLLQQALDQALGSLDELKAQVRDKQWVEAQLANTEKYANVQQQAIAHLKQQLTQFADVQHNLLNVIGYRLNELIDHQQHDVNHLHVHFQQSSAELQTYLQYLGRQSQTSQVVDPDSEEHRLALEAEVMVARSMAVHLSKHLGLARQHLGTLKTELDNHHLNIDQIIKTIQAMIADLENFDRPETTNPPAVPKARVEQEPETALSPQAVMDSVSGDELDIGELQALLRRQGLCIHELETVLMEQVEYGTQMRQRYQAIAAERDHYKQELEKLRRVSGQSGRAMPAQTEPLQPPLDPELHAPPTGTTSPPRYQRRSHSSQPIQPLKLPEEWE